MSEAEAVAWLTKRKWHVTDLRLKALTRGIDLERDVGGCSSWSDGGPCGTCIVHAIEGQRSPAAQPVDPTRVLH